MTFYLLGVTPDMMVIGSHKSYSAIRINAQLEDLTIERVLTPHYDIPIVDLENSELLCNTPLTIGLLPYGPALAATAKDFPTLYTKNRVETELATDGTGLAVTPTGFCRNWNRVAAQGIVKVPFDIDAAMPSGNIYLADDTQAVRSIYNNVSGSDHRLFPVGEELLSHPERFKTTGGAFTGFPNQLTIPHNASTAEFPEGQYNHYFSAKLPELDPFVYHIFYRTTGTTRYIIARSTTMYPTDAITKPAAPYMATNVFIDNEHAPNAFAELINTHAGIPLVTEAASYVPISLPKPWTPPAE